MKAFSNEKYLQEFKKEDTGRLPKGFENFVHSDLCSEFVTSIYDYCTYLIKLDDKKKELEADAKDRRIPPPKILKSELDRLNTKAKRMADNYGRLIFLNRSIGQANRPSDDPGAECKSRLQFRTKIYLNKENDVAFHNAVIKLLAHSLRTVFFDRVQMDQVEVEIDRLFRTNVFN
jgi:hypothetical protein